MEVTKIDSNGVGTAEIDSGESMRLTLILALWCLQKHGKQEIPMSQIKKIEKKWDAGKLDMNMLYIPKTKIMTAEVEDKS